MSFREKSAWIALVAYAAVFGGYFVLLWRNWDERYGQGLSIGLMFAAVVALVVIAAALNIAAALVSQDANAPADERERLINLKAEVIASYTLSVGVVCLIGALLLGWNPFLVANLLLAAMVIAELMKACAQIVFYRRSV